MRFILGCDIGHRIMLARFELGIAAFAHTDNRGRGLFDDPQSSVCHEYSLAPNACGNETAPAPYTLGQRAFSVDTIRVCDHDPGVVGTPQGSKLAADLL